MRRVISFLLSIMLGVTYWYVISNFKTTGDIETHKTAVINKVYEDTENAAILTLTNIKTASVTNVELNIPAYTQLKAFAYENALKEENTYSFKFRGLNIDYQVEYHDDINKPTVMLFEAENIYILNVASYLYEQPDINAEKTLVENNTTILVEYDVNNGWVSCITGDGRTGWMQLTKDTSDTTHINYQNATFLSKVENVKPYILCANITEFLNQFPNTQGISFTTVSQG